MLKIAVKRIDNGKYSRHLADILAVGNLVALAGIGGFFTLPPSEESFSQLAFFCAGIGITPALSMIKAALVNEEYEKKIVLFYSFTTAATAPFFQEIAALQARHPQHFTLVPLESSSKNLHRARMSRHLLPMLLDEQISGEPERVVCYACGPFAYMRMVAWGLEEWGIPKENIRREIFDTGSVNPLILLPPDTGTHDVSIRLAAREMKFPVAYPETILQAAERAGFSLPYSCRQGTCGSCALRCISGKVWASVNEVLTPGEIAKGLVLSCTGHPVDGDVGLEFF